MAAELPRPGVEVIQVFRTVSPTVVTPTLVPCIVGVCKQIVDVLVPAASGSSELNNEAVINLPGFFTAKAAAGDPPVYSGLDATHLVISVTNGPDIDVLLSGDELSAESVAAQLNGYFAENEVTEVFAEVSLDGSSWSLRTVGTGEFSTIEVRPGTSAAVLSAFGLTVGYVYSGKSVYSQYEETVPLRSFPDPRNNLAEISIEPDSVRVFLALGSGSNLRELSRTSSYLRNGGGGSAASVTGTIDLTTTSGLYGGAGALSGKNLTVALDGASPVIVSMGSGATAPANYVDVLAKINAALGGTYASSTPELRITSKTLGVGSSVLLGGNAAATLGMPTDLASGTAGVSVIDDGNGDSVSPLLSFLGQDFMATATSAVCTGLRPLSTLSYPGDLDGKTLTMSVSGKPPQTLTFDAPANPAAVVSQVQAFWDTSLLTASLSGGNLQLSTDLTGEDGTIKIFGGTALFYLGFVPAILGVNLLADIEPDLTSLNGLKLQIDFGGTLVEHAFSGFTGSSVVGDVASHLNADTAFSAHGVAYLDGGKLGIGFATTTAAGLRVVPASSNDAAYLLGFDTSADYTYFRDFKGAGHPPVSGDTLFVDGNFIGRVTAVAVGGDKKVLRLDKQLAITASYGSNFYLVANKIPTGSTTRPLPELVVDTHGVPTLKANVLRDTLGNPVDAKVSVYLAYTAVRGDVTARAKNPSLLSFSSTTELSSNLSPLNPLNPLALGMYFALLNAPGAQVTGLGVDEIAANAPYGTAEGYQRAAEALEQYEVYAIAPLTHDETVASVFNVHVSAMSAAESKGERICLFNFEKPAKRLDDLVASGLQGNSVGPGGLQFDTGIANLAALVLEKGVNPVGTIPTSAGLFLSIKQSSKAYSISGVSGSIVTVRTSFSSGDNDDGFYSNAALNASPLPSLLIDEPFNVKVRGAALLQPDGSPDKQAIAETYNALAQTYLNRRFWSVVPESCAATLGGIEQKLEGFYLCAAIAGMIGQQPPQQSFTNFPMVGFTRVMGSNDFFSEKQLNIIAGGGNYIVVQDVKSGPLTSRMALTTDTTSIETRTDSITKVVDFTAKFMRRGLRAYIGRYNITQGFLDSLGHVVQGLLGFLTEIGVLIGANLNNVVQDETAPDTVLIDVTLDVPFPCNYIRLTLVI